MGSGVLEADTGTSVLLRRGSVIRESIPAVVVHDRARIAGLAHPPIEFRAEALARGAVRRPRGDVFHLVRIAPQVVQLLGRTLGRGELEVRRDRRICPTIQEDRFRGSSVDITERPYRNILIGVARRPAIGTEVPDVEVNRAMERKRKYERNPKAYGWRG